MDEKEMKENFKEYFAEALFHGNYRFTIETHIVPEYDEIRKVVESWGTALEMTPDVTRKILMMNVLEEMKDLRDRSLDARDMLTKENSAATFEDMWWFHSQIVVSLVERHE